jgi:hypothetical protein
MAFRELTDFEREVIRPLLPMSRVGVGLNTFPEILMASS